MMRFRVLHIEFFALLALGLSACRACEPESLTELHAGIAVAPESVNLGDIPLGVHVSRIFTVTSTGDATLEIRATRLEGSSAIALDEAPSERIIPGASGIARIGARPIALGRAEAALIIESNARDRPEIRIPIALVGVPIPDCDDGNACTSDRFDPEASACKHAFTDGASCDSRDRCIIDASCADGVCVGQSRTCSDGSTCTRDLCRQSDGACVFIPDETACDDRNPCTADVCTASGCNSTSLPNGTPCDDDDPCTRGDTCFAGSCIGREEPNGSTCDDEDSCTTGDVCVDGRCAGQSILGGRNEGEIVFEYPLIEWTGRAFLHRREVSLGDGDIFYGLDHLEAEPTGEDSSGFAHRIFAMNQCGTEVYAFSYRPTDGHVQVSYVWREMQLSTTDELRVTVGVRHLEKNGFALEDTTHILDENGQSTASTVRSRKAEIGRSLLGDESHVYAVLSSVDEGPSTPDTAEQNLVVVREDVFGDVLWRHERRSGWFAEFLGVAGPRILFWASERFGALDFNTGATVWSTPTPRLTRELALSTSANLGVARTPEQLVGVEILEGTEVFVFPATPDPMYAPRTDPIIAADGRVLVVMQRLEGDPAVASLEWVELTSKGEVATTTPLPYVFPEKREDAFAPDAYADPYPTVADDGVAYVGYGDRFYAIDPGGHIRFELVSEHVNGFTGTVPLLRNDGILLISDGNRNILGVRTNGGRMSREGWASFRHDGRRTNYTP